MPSPLTLLADTARDLMTPGPVSIGSTATVSEAVAFLTDRGFGAALVIDEAGHPLGVVTRTDLLIHARERPGDGSQTAVRGVMTEGVFPAQENTPARSVVSQMVALNVHHLFVVDRAGVVVGVIGTLDVLRKLG